MSRPQIYKGDPRPRIPPRVSTSSAMGLKLGVFGFVATTHIHMRGNTQTKCAYDLRASCSVSCVFISMLSLSQTEVHCAPEESWLFWSWEKPEYTQPIWAPCRNKNAVGSGISLGLVYLRSRLNFSTISWYVNFDSKNYHLMSRRILHYIRFESELLSIKPGVFN